MIDTYMVPSKLTVKAEVEFLDEEMIETAITKIEYWLDNYVSKSIVFSALNEHAFEMFLDDKRAPRINNIFMITPDDPTDEHIAMILQAKLQSLSNGAFEVGVIELTSDNSAGLAFTYVGIGKDELPTMDEWISGENWFDQPWWCRNDASTLDTLAPEGTDMSVIPEWAMSLDFLGNDVSNPEAIILNVNFEPKIVE